jgi:hypothetical protein
MISTHSFLNYAVTSQIQAANLTLTDYKPYSRGQPTSAWLSRLSWVIQPATLTEQEATGRPVSTYHGCRSRQDRGFKIQDAAAVESSSLECWHKTLAKLLTERLKIHSLTCASQLRPFSYQTQAMWEHFQLFDYIRSQRIIVMIWKTHPEHISWVLTGQLTNLIWEHYSPTHLLRIR